MQRFDTGNTAGLEAVVTRWITDFPADITCPVQIWYEALGGYGAPAAEDLAAISAALDKQPNWERGNSTRYEKYGSQPTWKKPSGQVQPNHATGNHYAVQHMFKVNGVYAAPDGKKYKVVLSEYYNLRCFEVDGKGNMLGSMVKIHPLSDLAKSLKESA